MLIDFCHENQGVIKLFTLNYTVKIYKQIKHIRALEIQHEMHFLFKKKDLR